MTDGWRTMFATLTLIAIAPTAAGAADSRWQPASNAESPFVAGPPTAVLEEADSEPGTAGAATIVGVVVDGEASSIYRLPPVAAPDEPQQEATCPEQPRPATAARRLSEPLEPATSDAVESLLPDELPAEIVAEPDFLETGGRPDDPGAAAIGALPYTPTVAELSQRMLPSVRHGFEMARRGAVYAAQAEFIKVLRRIAAAKDAQDGHDDHCRALAAGLRALDEADDFMPVGTQLEAEIDVTVVASSHRTAELLGHQARTPHEMVAWYHDFARRELGRSVVGERAGSMALYGLGKVHNRLALDSDEVLRHERKAMTLFLAALEAGPDNHLAANEVGVLLARGGRPAEAAAMFRRAIDAAPSSTAYHNLAMVERKLGQFAQADANERYAAELAARDRAAGLISQNKGIQWVAPQQMSPAAPPPMPAAQARVAPPPQPAPDDAVRWPGVGAPAQTESVARWPLKLFPNAFRR